MGDWVDGVGDCKHFRAGLDEEVQPMTVPLPIPESAVEAAAQAIWESIRETRKGTRWVDLEGPWRTMHLRQAEAALRAAVEQVGWYDEPYKSFTEIDTWPTETHADILDAKIWEPIFRFVGSDR